MGRRTLLIDGDLRKKMGIAPGGPLFCTLKTSPPVEPGPRRPKGSPGRPAGSPIHPQQVRNLVHALAADEPLRLEPGLLLGRGIGGGGSRRTQRRSCSIAAKQAGFRKFLARLIGVRAEGGIAIFVERTILGGHAIMRGALEHIEMFGLLGDDRRGLHSAGSRADNADTQAAHIDVFLGPTRTAQQAATERIRAGNRNIPRLGQIAGRHDEKAGLELQVRARIDMVALFFGIPLCAGHRR